jgi:hypothetical protein
MVVGWLGGRFIRPTCPAIVETRTDTVVIRDTIREYHPVVKEILTTRISVDTLRLPGDTVFIAVEVPIEKRVYESSDYRAEISGFKPSLDLIEVYPKTKIVNTTQTLRISDPRRWGIGPYIGYGFSAQNGKVIGIPTVGISLQYQLIQW